MRNKKQILFLILLFLFSLGLRIYYMNDGLYHHDSIQIAKAVQQTVDVDLSKIYPTNNNRYGMILIFSVLYYPFQSLDIEKFLTVISILFSALAIVMVYLFVSELTSNKTVAGFTALLFSVMPLSLSITTYLKSHGIAILFIMLGGYFFLKALKTTNNIYWWSSLFFILFSLLIRKENVFLLVPLSIILFYRKRFYRSFNNNPEEWKSKEVNFKELFFVGLFFISGSILYLFKIIVLYHNDNKLNVTLFFSMISSLITSIGLFAAGIIFVGLVYMVIDKKHFELVLLGSWFFSMFIFLGLNVVASSRLMYLAIIPLLIICCYGIEKISFENKIVYFIVFAIIVISMIHFITPIIEYRSEHSSVKDMMLYLKDNTEPNAVIGMYGDYGVFIKYYAEREAIICCDTPVINITGRPLYMIALNPKEQAILEESGKYEYFTEHYFEEYHHSELTSKIGKAYIYKKKE